ncbi:MAG: hypothetical protein LAP38_12825 [Acidobacteriia bacterium]|nr:hypothetical protein [Terriglobia bacterium]
MSWEYLQYPVLQVRQELAAHFLRGSRRILEIGGYKTPLTHFLTHEFDEVVVIDPLIESYEASERGGRPCSIRHLALDLDEFDMESWLKKPFACVFCGMDLNRVDKSPVEWLRTVCQFLLLLSHADIGVIEYPVNWQSSVQLFHVLLSILQPQLAADIRIDLSRYPDAGTVSDEVRSRLVRRLVVLRNSDKVEKIQDIQERVARALFGSHAAKVVLDLSKAALRAVADAFDIRNYKVGFVEPARAEFNDGLDVTTAPLAWSFAVLIPFQPSSQASLQGTTAVMAGVEVQLYVETGEVGIGLLPEGGESISGERLIKAAPGQLQTVELFIPDARGHIGVMCRNGRLDNTVSKARIVKIALSIAPPQREG